MPFAGNGTAGHAGDGGPAVAAALAGSTGVEADAAGTCTSPNTTAGSGVSPPTARSRSTRGSAAKGSAGTTAPPHRRGSSTRTTSRSGRRSGLRRRHGEPADPRIDPITPEDHNAAADVGIVVSVAVAADGTVYGADVARDGVGGGITMIRPGARRRIYSREVSDIAVGPDGQVCATAWTSKRILLYHPRREPGRRSRAASLRRGGKILMMVERERIVRGHPQRAGRRLAIRLGAREPELLAAGVDPHEYGPLPRSSGHFSRSPAPGWPRRRGMPPYDASRCAQAADRPGARGRGVESTRRAGPPCSC